MKDTQISAGTAVAWALWAISGAVAVLVMLFNTRGLGVVSIIAAVAGCTATIRTYLVQQSRLMRTLAASRAAATEVRTIR